jgi:hypothetical protein
VRGIHQWTPEGVVGRLARALEAVAGTLRKLSLWGSLGDDPPAGACYELGAAIGKLRRLRDVNVDMLHDGRDFLALGRGVAASGGCPELFKMQIDSVKRRADLLTYKPSLIVPTLGRLHIKAECTEEEALVLCCGLVQVGYKHRFEEDDLRDSQSPDHKPFGEPVRACLRAILETRGVA